MIVVALNGLLGNRRKRLDVTEIVDTVLPSVPTWEDVTVVKGRGGSGKAKFNKLVKRVEGHAHNREVLCLVGKSYGAHWCLQLLWKLAERDKLHKFKSVGMVTVDPAYALHKLQRRTKSIPDIDRAVNLHQYGFRSGYRVGFPARNIALVATHKNIDTHKQVAREIEDLLLWGYVKHCQ